MKIGILTLFHNNINWGGVLQGYALKSYIEREFPNAQVDILRYTSKANIVYPNMLMQALQYTPDEITARVSRILIKKFGWEPDIGDKIANRFMRFEEFTEDNTSNDRIYNDTNLVYAAKEYDCLICGSDQIWNPNVSKPGYYLSGIGNECVKISYAASIARNRLSRYERKIMLPFIRRFDFVSVREKTAKRILDRYLGSEFKTYEVLDPVLMLSADFWEDMSNARRADKNYALAFFFSESIEYRREIERYCNDKKLALKFIPFAKNEYVKSDENGGGQRLYDVGPREFIRLFLEATCVFTDSFHGTVFSILFRKPFCVFERDKNNRVSKNSRLHDLLDKFELHQRVVQDTSQLAAAVGKAIDFDKIRVRLEQYRADSQNFLRKALESVTEKNYGEKETIAELDDAACCGCGLCADICPKKCITMEDSTEGFSYPRLDEKNCMKCNRCVELCPALQHQKTGKFYDCYVGYNGDDKIRLHSSSGGFFYEIAKLMIYSGGIVYGAAFDELFHVKHMRVDGMEKLKLFQTSKYVQSDMQNIYNHITEDLKNGKTVMFSGTPCQTAAVYNIAQKRKLDEKLYLVDFICHGVPSPVVWRSYLEYLSERDVSKIKRVNFRDKVHGTCSWHDYCFYVEYHNRTQRVCAHEMDVYMDSFLTNQNLRDSCYDCRYKDGAYRSDITLGDAWKVEKTNMEWADDKGTSLLVVRSDKGRSLLEQLPKEFKYVESSYKTWSKYNSTLVSSPLKPENRQSFFERFKNRESDDAFWTEQKKGMQKKRIKCAVKRVLKVSGLGRAVRRFL